MRNILYFLKEKKSSIEEERKTDAVRAFIPFHIKLANDA